MSDKTSNRASIIVALVAIFLILGAIFLLNQTLNSPKEVSNTVADNSAEEDKNSTDEENLIQEPTNSDQEIADPVVEDEQVQDEPVEEELPNEDEETTEEDKDTEEVKVESNQLTAEAANVASDGMVDFTIKNCGLEKPIYCKSGNKIKLSLKRFDIKKGSTYLITGNIVDTRADGFQISVSSIKEV